jgi:hypothetical protein
MSATTLNTAPVLASPVRGAVTWVRASIHRVTQTLHAIADNVVTYGVIEGSVVAAGAAGSALFFASLICARM